MFNKPILFGFVLSIILAGTGIATAQTAATSTNSAAETQKIKEKITKMGIGADATISQREGKTFHGAISQINADSFVLSDVDLKANVELRYDQIKRIDKGYSHPDPITGRRTPPKIRKTIGWVLAGVAVVLVVVIVKTLNDPNF
jgi:hypothetical protein